MVYDFIVVGAGMYGATFARLATDAGAKCLVVDERTHVGGNCYSERVCGIDVHKYGPHIFHTDDEQIWQWICRFGDFAPFVNSAKACVDGTLYSWPVNLLTLHQVFGVSTPEEARRLMELERSKRNLANADNFEQWCLATLGDTLYEMFYKGFSEKMWGCDCRELPVSTAARLPVRLTFDDRYYQSRYVGVPDEGWGAWFERLLEGIKVKLNERWGNCAGIAPAGTVVIWTGKIDEFFDYRFGRLPYRSLIFEERAVNGTQYGATWITYPGRTNPITRVVEHKFLNVRQSDNPKTVVTWERPVDHREGNIPMYPLSMKGNVECYNRYRGEADKVENVVIGGRLGEYEYLDMDEAIKRATKAVKEVVL